ncbi:MAG: hypothetical protein J3K34DRAFT_521184 [Monoraphidium minutum]|nr:MAG: hypothetical protein J3K34DRAFT_521184 [Monoraphidium minutum]
MKRKAAEASEDGPDRAAQFAAHLRSLNKQYASWVRQQAAEHGDELWADGARAYARYADELTAEFEDVLEAGDAGAPGSSAPAFNFPGASSSGGGAPAFGAPAFGAPAAGGFAFGGAPAPAAGGSPAPFAFSSTPTAGGGGLFGTPGGASGGGSPGSTPGAAKPGMFSVGGGGGGGDGASTAGHTPGPAKFAFGAAAAPAGGGFSFPAPAANGGGADGGGGGDGGGGDEDEGAQAFKPEIAVDEGTFEIFYSSKSKLLVLAEGADGKKGWEQRGLGLLSVRRFKAAGDGKAYVFFTTEAGKTLVLHAIQASTKLSKSPPDAKGPGAKRITGVLMLREEAAVSGATAVPPDNPTYKPQSVMFALGSAEKADDFLAEVDKRRPAS